MGSLFTLIVIIVIASSLSGIVKAALGYHGRRIPAADRDALRRIEQGLLELREDLGAVRDDVTELQERVDFAERLLARSRDEELRLGRG